MLRNTIEYWVARFKSMQHMDVDEIRLQLCNEGWRLIGSGAYKAAYSKPCSPVVLKLEWLTRGLSSTGHHQFQMYQKASSMAPHLFAIAEGVVTEGMILHVQERTSQPWERGNWEKREKIQARWNKRLKRLNELACETMVSLGTNWKNGNGFYDTIGDMKLANVGLSTDGQMKIFDCHF